LSCSWSLRSSAFSSAYCSRQSKPHGRQRVGCPVRTTSHRTAWRCTISSSPPSIFPAVRSTIRAPSATSRSENISVGPCRFSLISSNPSFTTRSTNPKGSTILQMFYLDGLRSLHLCVLRIRFQAIWVQTAMI
jgi:hypothetical protein